MTRAHTTLQRTMSIFGMFISVVMSIGQARLPLFGCASVGHGGYTIHLRQAGRQALFTHTRRTENPPLSRKNRRAERQLLLPLKIPTLYVSGKAKNNIYNETPERTCWSY